MAWPPENGKPYLPSNGTEGMRFRAEWCDVCEWLGEDDETGCAILAGSFCGEVPQWTWVGGRPSCSEFKPWPPDPNGMPPPVDPRQTSMDALLAELDETE